MEDSGDLALSHGASSAGALTGEPDNGDIPKAEDHRPGGALMVGLWGVATLLLVGVLVATALTLVAGRHDVDTLQHNEDIGKKLDSLTPAQVSELEKLQSYLNEHGKSTSESDCECTSRSTTSVPK